MKKIFKNEFIFWITVFILIIFFAYIINIQIKDRDRATKVFIDKLEKDIARDGDISIPIMNYYNNKVHKNIDIYRFDDRNCSYSIDSSKKDFTNIIINCKK